MDDPSDKPGNANLPIGVKKGAIQENGAPRWHSRGYLPHFESPVAPQHVTFHLADSLPKTALVRLDAELKTLPAEKRAVERRKRVESWLDAGHGSCVLREPRIAEMVQGSLLAFAGERYRMLAWVVMPNHVHVLFQPINAWTIAKTVASWKKFTARKIYDYVRERAEREKEHSANREIGGPGVWHREYWDRYIRDERHLDHAIAYIQTNPVKAGLAARPEDWRWSSAFPGNANLLIGEGNRARNKDAIRENGGPTRKP